MAGWTDALIKRKGRPEPTFRNICVALRQCPAWFNVLAFNRFSIRAVLINPPPWDMNRADFVERNWEDHDDLSAWNWIQEQNILVPLGTITNAIEAVASDRSFNPVIDYLDALQWDGTPRLDDFLIKYFGGPCQRLHPHSRTVLPDQRHCARAFTRLPSGFVADPRSRPRCR
jgi:putative DNA primase/helicase